MEIKEVWPRQITPSKMGHVETHTMQTVQTECYFFLLVPNFLVEHLLK